MQDNEYKLLEAADDIDDYCSEIGCRKCIISVLCNALDHEVPLGEQIRELVGNKDMEDSGV